MKIEKNQIDELNAELTLVIEKEDYLDDYNKQLKSYREKAHMKGFRKGKTPMTVVKKMYGNSLLQESVSKILTEKINNLIDGDEYNIIGEPYLVDRENLPQLDFNEPSDYQYKFEIGLEPEFNLIGIADSDVYPKHKIAVTSKMIDEEVESLLKRLGEQKSVEGPIVDNDVVYFTARELFNDKVLVDGHSAEFSCGMDKLTDNYAKQVLGMKVGESLNADVYQLEKDLPADQVEKYLLKVTEDQDISGMGNNFRLVIKDIVRVELAKFDQEAFDKSFGKDEVKSEEEARTKIEEFLVEHFEKESNNLVNREIMETLMTVNSLQLPETFLKKWMAEKSEKPMTEDQFGAFKKELKWRIIKKKMVKKFEVEVKEEEIFQHFVTAIRNYSPYIDEQSLKNTVFSLMKNREQVNTAVETISSAKVFDKVREVVQTEEKPIDKEGFYEIVKSMNEKAS